jgi:hypothetical protein
MENQQLVSSSRQRSSTPVCVGQEFLSKEQCDNIRASPHSSGSPPADIYLFPRLKSALKKRHICDAPDIIKNATEELKKLS